MIVINQELLTRQKANDIIEAILKMRENQRLIKYMKNKQRLRPNDRVLVDTEKKGEILEGYLDALIEELRVRTENKQYNLPTEE